MNRLILKYGTPITVVILLIFVWVVASRLTRGVDAVIPLIIAAVIVWAIGTVLFIVFWPRITVNGFKRAFLARGLGDGPIPINTLHTAPGRSSDAASSSSVMATGADDLLYVGGWLDLRRTPQMLHVPASEGRYYSLQFTDPVSGANFGYVGTRTTGPMPAAVLLCTAGEAGADAAMSRMTVPHGTALVVGRVFVADEADRIAAEAFAKRIRLTPLT